MSMSIFFQTTGGGWYVKTFYITDQWATYVFPLLSFRVCDGSASGWNNVTKVRLSCWQHLDISPATAYISDLCASTGVINLLANSDFEVTTAEAMPDYWDPANSSVGIAADQWVLDTDSWRVAADLICPEFADFVCP